MYQLSFSKTALSLATGICLLLTIVLSVGAFSIPAFANDTLAAADTSSFNYVAHKGKTLPSQLENVRVTFEKTAKNKNVYALETDIYRTADGHYVCIHGVGGKKAIWGGYDVKATDYQTLKNTHPDGQTICSFKEFLRICKKNGKHASIDLKDVRFASHKKYTETLVSICYQEGMLGNCSFHSVQSEATNMACSYAKSKYGINAQGFAVARDSKESVDAAISYAKEHDFAGITVQKNQLPYAFKQKGDLLLGGYVYKDKAKALADQKKFNLHMVCAEFPV